MTPAAGLREIGEWPRRRFGVGVGAAAVSVLALASVTGLSPFGSAGGAGWRYPLVLLLAALIGLYSATAVRAPVGAEMTLCDLRWPVFAAIAMLYADRDTTMSAGLGALFDIAAATLMAWAVGQRLEQERRALSGADGEVCLTCRPLFAPRSRGGASVSEPAIRPLTPAPVRVESRPEKSGGLL